MRLIYFGYCLCLYNKKPLKRCLQQCFRGSSSNDNNIYRILLKRRMAVFAEAFARRYLFRLNRRRALASALLPRLKYLLSFLVLTFGALIFLSLAALEINLVAFFLDMARRLRIQFLMFLKILPAALPMRITAL